MCDHTQTVTYSDGTQRCLNCGWEYNPRERTVRFVQLPSMIEKDKKKGK